MLFAVINTVKKNFPVLEQNSLFSLFRGHPDVL